MEIEKRTCFIDLLKFIALIFMPIIHAFGGFILFETMTEQYPYDLLETVMNVLYWFTPSIFMMCMGFGLYFSHRNKPIDFAKRGLKLLLVFLLLNFARYPLLTFIKNIFCGGLNTEWLIESLEWLLGNDILAFAGLFFLLYALLIKITKNDIVILVFSIVLFIASTFIPRDITIENGILNCFLSNFIYTENTYFPIFSWFMIPIIGYEFYKYFTKSKNQDHFMLITMIVAALAFVVSYISIDLSGLMQESFFMWGEGDFLFDIPTMLFLIEINFIYIPIIYFIAKLIQRSKVVTKFISFEAKNINTLYCVHWIILMGLFIFLGDTGLLNANNLASPFVLGIIVFIVTSLITWLYNKIKHKKLQKS